MAKAARTPAETEALLTEIRERFDYASDNWKDIRDAGDVDMRTVAGDPWDPEDRKEREALNRPCLSLDELGQYYNQIINDILANPIAMKFDPKGDGASPAGAEFYVDKAREIEYRSHAQIAYTTAFQNTIHRSFGWVRLETRYESDKSANQDIWIVDIPDPNKVIPDPDAKRPDSSDIKFLFYIESYLASEFKRKWPNAKITDFTGDVAQLAPSWIKGEKIQVAEYWKIRTTQRVLSLFQNPQGQSVQEFEDDLRAIPAGFVKVRELRTVPVPSVCQYLTNGVEILETNEWAGKYIPFASCFGPVLYRTEGGQTKRILMSMTRLAHDPYMLYCYYRTAQAEVVGRATKNAAIGYEGQFAGHEDEWAKSIHEPLAFLEAKAITDGTGPNNVLPLPQLNNWEPPIQALEMGAEGARRAIQAAMGGSPLPTQAQRHNEKSGVALRQMESSAQKGSYHFVNHYQDMIRHVGIMIEDLMDKIYDTPRDVGIRKPNGSAETVRINDPQATNAQGAPAAISTKGSYLVTVSTGPSNDSTRQAASDFMDQLAQNPQVFPLIASELVRMKELGPIGDEMANALEILKPPELRQQKGQAPLPPQAQQAMAENAHLKQQLQAATEAIKTDQAKQQALIAKAKIDADQAIKIQIMKDATAIAVAKINASAKGGITAQEAQNEALALAQQQAADAEQQVRDQAHDVGMAALEHQHALEQAAQGHQQQLEQGQQQAAITADQQQAAAVQPPQPGA